MEPCQDMKKRNMTKYFLVLSMLTIILISLSIFHSEQKILAYGQTSPTPTTTAVTSSQNPSASGQSVTFTATILPPALPFSGHTGSVQFQIDGTNAGSP